MNPDNSSHQNDDFDADAPHEAEQLPVGSLEDILEHHMADVDAEHALLLRMWNIPGRGKEATTLVDATVSQAEAAPGHVTVLHQARALTAGDLRAALIGLPDDQPVAIDVPLDPGGLVLHRYVLTSTAATVLLLADEEEVLDPSLVLRGDFPTGVYEIPTEDAPAGDASAGDSSPRTH
ncbi:DUF6225 family protein [Kineococcus sp. R86509]|uniref:DUF6225 family protein n=1 Tax=Kineococcus sp. R86509 TaxID=3093851 RepID=UPI0036D20B40